MARKLKEEYEKWGIVINLEKKTSMYGGRKRQFEM
jgi:hypothetical protein